MCAVFPAGGPAFHHHYGADGRVPGKPPWWNLPLSVVWALVPLGTAGFATPLIIGHAAVRLKSRIAGFATGIYSILLLAFVIISGIYSDNDPTTKEPEVDVIVGVFILVNWLGATVHAFILRSSVFRTRPTVHFPSGTWRYTPVPPHHHRTPMPPTGPYHAPAPHPGTRAFRDGDGPPPAPRPYQASTPQPYQATPTPPSSPSPWYPADTASGSRPFDSIGPYRLDQKIGEGGQGAVYLAYGPGGQPVAVKVLHSRIIGGAAERESFIREAAMARRVRPFATARVIDVGVVGDVAYIISEYVPGPSLERLVREEGPRGGDSLTRLAIGTAAALAGHPDLSVLLAALQAPLAACLAKDPGGRPTAAEVMMRVTS
ncbi:protein kinase domain-containing protein [Streptosporangium sp. NPDC002607]